MSAAEHTGRRRVAALGLALPLAAATALASSTLTASPANAGRVHVSSTKLTSTSQSVTVSVDLGLLEQGKLGLTPPGGSKPVQVASGSGPKKLSYTLSLSCPTYTGSCIHDGRKTPARNGTWTVTFGSKVLVLGSGSESSFRVAAPPARPTGVSAKAPSSDHVTVHWNKGAEPDLSSYRVTVAGRPRTVSAAGACGGSSCSASVPAPASGGKTGVSVAATRDGYGSPLSSSTAKTSVNVPVGGSGGRSAGYGPGGMPVGSGGGSGGSGGYPRPGLQPGGGGSASWPGGMVPSGNPYPSFGVRPKVAPATSQAARPAVRPLSFGSARGDTAVPVAMALVIVLAGGHVWLWSRGGLRPAVPSGLLRIAHYRRKH